MYFVNPKYRDAVVYGKKRIVLSSATQDELKELYDRGHTNKISVKAKTKNEDEKPKPPKRTAKEKQE